VLEVLAGMFPTADFFCLIADPKFVPEALRQRSLTRSFLDRLPLVRRHNQHFFFLYPLATESLNLHGYDLVISSDGMATKGVVTDEAATHLCYCHSPHRSLWDQYSEYQRTLTGLKRVVFTALSHYVRQWDFQAAQRPDIMIANSEYLAARIRKYYRRDSMVLYPPVDTSRGYLSQLADDYYLTVGRLTSLKRTELIVQACTDLGRRLIVVGAGDELERLKAMAGSTVSFLGYVDEEKLRELYARCRAFLFAAKEDFGIAPVEAQSYGRPVIAFGQGGALESVKGWTREGMAPAASCTGLFFEHQTVASLSEAIREFESVEEQFDPAHVRAHSLRFDTSLFRSAIRNIVDSGAASHHELFVESNFIAQPETMHA
jgi:glycosyltransferase involved in cell wall biosynthesis